MHVNLSRGNRTRPRKVHRLVLEAFVGPCPIGMEGCHNDGVPEHNRLGNLRWDTHRENIQDIFRIGRTTAPKNPLRGSDHGGAVLEADDVRCIRAEPAFRGVGKMLARAFGVTDVTIGHIRSGRTWTHIQ